MQVFSPATNNKERASKARRERLIPVLTTSGSPSMRRDLRSAVLLCACLAAGAAELAQSQSLIDQLKNQARKEIEDAKRKAQQRPNHDPVEQQSAGGTSSWRAGGSWGAMQAVPDSTNIHDATCEPAPAPSRLLTGCAAAPGSQSRSRGAQGQGYWGVSCSRALCRRRLRYSSRVRPSGIVCMAITSLTISLSRTL